MGISKELNLGRAGEYLVMADLLLKGLQVYDTAQGVSYDLVVDIRGRLIRIQVKLTQKMRMLRPGAKPIYFFNIKRQGKKGTRVYQKGDFDGFALVALDRREVFYLPFDSRVKSASICIRDKDAVYVGKQRGGPKNRLFFQDLTWDNFIADICRK